MNNKEILKIQIDNSFLDSLVADIKSKLSTK